MSTIEQVIGKQFLKKKSFLGEKERETLYVVQDCNVDELTSAKFVLLYFSAGWCPPCTQFQQLLKDFYNEANIDEKVVEIVYVSSDKSEAEFKETYAKMPWLTYRWESGQHAALKDKFDIVGVPVVLVLHAKTGFLVSTKGRKDICELSINCLKNWTNELPAMIERKKHLDAGAAVVEQQRLLEEEEDRKRREAEKNDD